MHNRRLPSRQGHIRECENRIYRRKSHSLEVKAVPDDLVAERLSIVLESGREDNAGGEDDGRIGVRPQVEWRTLASWGLRKAGESLERSKCPRDSEPKLELG